MTAAEPEDRPLPQSPDAERAVLGSILIDPGAFWRVSAMISAGDFFKDSHRVIWATASALAADRQEIDLLTVKDLLRRRGELDLAGGGAYVSSLTDSVPSVASVETAAAIVADHARLRRLLMAGNAIMRAAGEPGADPAEVARAAAEQLANVSAPAEQRARPLAEVLQASHEAKDRRVAANIPMALVTKSYPELDRMQALRPTLIVLGAPSQHGKTALLVNLWLALGERGAAALYVTNESTEEEISDRTTSIMTGIYHSRMRRWSGVGGLTDEDRSVFKHVYAQAGRGKLTLRRSLRTVESIEAECRRQKATAGLNAVFVDYIQLLRLERGPRDREERMAEIAQRLLEMAIDLEIAVICASQLNKDRMDRSDGRIHQGDLKYAAAIGESARIVLLFQRPRADNKADHHRAECEVAFQLEKNNEGLTGDFAMHFDLVTQRFTEGDCLANRCRHAPSGPQGRLG